MTKDAVDNALQVADSAQGCSEPAQALDTGLSIEAGLTGAEHARRYRHMAPKNRRPRIGRATVKNATKALALLSNASRLDRRTRESQFVEHVQEALTTALGGRARLSPQRTILVRNASRSALILELTDEHVLSMESVVNRGKRALYPVILQRRILADALREDLKALGLDAMPADVKTLRDLKAVSSS